MIWTISCGVLKPSGRRVGRERVAGLVAALYSLGASRMVVVSVSQGKAGWQACSEGVERRY